MKRAGIGVHEDFMGHDAAAGPGVQEEGGGFENEALFYAGVQREHERVGDGGANNAGGLRYIAENQPVDMAA